ncbi:hypothetical protein GOP47_0013073 [Adiantum capillus-veneris]|uniref:Uncharacterized protein n=1 Tax=Adiantum capillus-veneris TaxID=13818 RepID=A0A9D4ZGA6_ADICA|nr:hypothetical protein GOP47_0013073 [Adiantum capillus-veneris]
MLQYRRSGIPHLELVHDDCFEPAPNAGFNTICFDTDYASVCWFNPSLHETWVRFNNDHWSSGMWLEYVSIICGSLYGIFLVCKFEGQDEDSPGQEDSTLLQRTIMKGTMSVSSNCNVHWEEVLDIGLFWLAHTVNFPITHFTLMV